MGVILFRKSDFCGVAVLHLPSWYPDPVQPTNGNFVERQIAIAARLVPSIVVHAYADVNLRKYQLNVNESGGFPEIRVGYPPKKSQGIPSRFIAWNMGIQKAINILPTVDSVHVHVSDSAALMALWLKWTRGWAYGISEHDSAFLPESPSHPRYGKMLKWAIRKASFHSAVSKHLASAIQDFAGLSETPFVLPNPIADRFAPALETPREPYILHISGFQPVKGMKEALKGLLSVLRLHEKAKLVLIGEPGPDLSGYLEASATFPGRILYLGVLSAEEIVPWMHRSACLIHPSFYETMGITLWEAMTCRLPLVVRPFEPMQSYARQSGGTIYANEDEMVNGIISLLEKRHHAKEIVELHEVRSAGIQQKMGLMYKKAGWVG